jgi:hypothetical protein
VPISIWASQAREARPTVQEPSATPLLYRYRPSSSPSRIDSVLEPPYETLFDPWIQKKELTRLWDEEVNSLMIGSPTAAELAPLVFE